CCLLMLEPPFRGRGHRDLLRRSESRAASAACTRRAATKWRTAKPLPAARAWQDPKPGQDAMAAI
ncbi:hypothetical protein, partial [Rhizobium ruizarguesonis]|uniref:hypothetical protein n=1 Tax=Rhizobium ruizarguesonis TaxID=2081791 RepID=UPI0019549CC9